MIISPECTGTGLSTTARRLPAAKQPSPSSSSPNPRPSSFHPHSLSRFRVSPSPGKMQLVGLRPMKIPIRFPSIHAEGRETNKNATGAFLRFLWILHSFATLPFHLSFPSPVVYVGAAHCAVTLGKDGAEENSHPTSCKRRLVSGTFDVFCSF